jgi:hypothetical protein
MHLVADELDWLESHEGPYAKAFLVRCRRTPPAIPFAAVVVLSSLWVFPLEGDLWRPQGRSTRSFIAERNPIRAENSVVGILLAVIVIAIVFLMVTKPTWRRASRTAGTTSLA